MYMCLTEIQKKPCLYALVLFHCCSMCNSYINKCWWGSFSFLTTTIIISNLSSKAAGASDLDFLSVPVLTINLMARKSTVSFKIFSITSKKIDTFFCSILRSEYIHYWSIKIDKESINYREKKWKRFSRDLTRICNFVLFIYMKIVSIL